MRSEQPHRRVYTMLVIVTLWTMIAAIPVSAQRDQDADPNRRRHYMEAMFGPPTLIRIAGATVIDQIRDSPDDWDQDVGGFGQRLASNAGARWINVSVRYGVATLQNRNVEYQRCECTDTRGRIRQAVLGSVTDYDASGKRHFSVARLSGAAAGSAAKMIWVPDYDIGNAATGIVTSLAVTTAGNLIREFILHDE